MNVKKVLGIVLLLVGLLALVYRGFTYTEETHDADLGPIELSVKEKKSVAIPVWLGVGLVLVGGALLVVGRKN